MAKAKNVQEGGIMLAENWKLYPVDERNWELCRYAAVNDTPVSRANGTAGQMRWQPLGRFYSYGTVGEALAYVADELVKEKARQQALTLRTALAEYARACRTLREAVAR